MAAILEAAHSGLDLVIKTAVYVSDISLWAQANAMHAAFFGDHRPAGAVVPAQELHYGFQIEIEAIAAVDRRGKRKEIQGGDDATPYRRCFDRT